MKQKQALKNEKFMNTSGRALPTIVYLERLAYSNPTEVDAKLFENE